MSTSHARASSAQQQHPLATTAAVASAPLRPATLTLQDDDDVTAMATAPLDDDAAAMLDILDMDLDMSIPDVVVATSAAHALPVAAAADALVVAAPQPLVVDHDAQSAAAMKSQTCVTFLHIMKEFSESSCNATEMVERVDSLVHQDEQLLKLLPLTKAHDTTSDAHRRDARHSSDDAMDVDSDSASDSRLASPRSVDLERSTSALLRKLSVDLVDCSDSSRKTRALDAALDDHDARAAKRRRENDREMDAHDELQRWIDLDLELDHRMDVFDFTQDAVEGVGAGPSPPVSRTSLPVTQALGRTAPSPFLTGVKAPTGALRNHASAVSRDLALQRSAAWSSSTAAGLDKKSVTAALFGDDDDDDATDSSSSSAASSVIDTMARAKLLANASSSAAARSAAIAAASAAETKCDDENVWGVEDDEYQQDLLSSIDHSVLCDRENRFLQWDLEMEAQQQQQHLMTTPPPSSSFSTSSSPTRPSAASSASASAVSGSMVGDRSKHKWLLASSPREKIAKSPSNVDIVDDWSSLDFGTFQNRTVSHILSSCLHKRKLYHPYKHQVKLVNFNVSGSAAIADPVEPTPHRGSLATSLAFGGAHDDELARSSGTVSGANSNPGASALTSASATPYGMKDSASSGLDKSGVLLKGEKKSKKREERKRLMSLKMQETFADLEGTFTEQDLDFKNVAGAGSLSKMALAKLEALPLPDLSNLPQDLKELKRKIEATEHKVEGTKHRHRKGGPCPRCQVQNQLRAAKRAYHKRAVAHKKLPQTSALPGASAATAPVSSSSAALETEPNDVLFRSPPLTPTPAASAFDGTSPSLSPASSASPATSAMRAASGAPFLPVVLPASVLSTTAPAAKPSASLLASVGAPSSAASSALLQHRQQTAAAQLVKNASRSLVAAAAGMAPHAPARPASSFQTSAPRRPCGNTFAASSTSSAGASSAPSSSTATGSPPTPKTASPHVQHVTVTSA